MSAPNATPNLASHDYRYTLTRSWRPADGRVALWIMLNPSTADETTDDQTIRKVIGFSCAMAGAVEVVNLYALRATSPKALANCVRAARDGTVRWDYAIGTENDEAIAQALRRAHTVIAAWGAHNTAAHRVERVRSLIGSRPVFCLGMTQSGAPRHPLYVSYRQRLERWA